MRKKLHTALASPWTRIAIVFSVAWLLYLQACQPWNGCLSRHGGPLQALGCHFWRIGAALAGNHYVGPIPVTIGLLAISFVIFSVAWIWQAIWHSVRPRKA